MKIAKGATSILDTKKDMDVPILPLVPVKRKLTKENSLTYKLRTQPTNADLTT